MSSYQSHYSFVARDNIYFFLMGATNFYRCIFIQNFIGGWGQDSSVGTVTRLWAWQPMNLNSIP
jgi:hypothetical protein